MADDRQSSDRRQRDPEREARGGKATAPELWIGCCGLGPHPARYFRRLNALELQQSFFEPPRRPALTRLRVQASERFAFVLRAWQIITHEPGSPGYRRLRAPPTTPDACGLFRPTELVREATARTFTAARDLGARAVLFETPPSFSPSAVHRERIARYFETVDRAGMLLVWDPRGVWSPEAALAVCRDLGLVLCRDPSAPDYLPPSPGEVAYFKLQGMGRRGTVAEDDLLAMLEHAANAQTFCLFNTIDQLRDAERLRALCEGDVLDRG